MKRLGLSSLVSACISGIGMALVSIGLLLGPMAPRAEAQWPGGQVCFWFCFCGYGPEWVPPCDNPCTGFFCAASCNQCLLSPGEAYCYCWDPTA